MCTNHTFLSLKAVLVFFVLTCTVTILNAQIFPFSFSIDRDTEPKVERGLESLQNAWTGGLSAVHIASIDLNGDGQDDLLVFDRIGKQAHCFLYEKPSNGMSNKGFPYIYTPEYVAVLPPLNEWVKTCDYNADGKADIFTFNGVSGISVYKNISGYKNGKWELKFENLYSKLPALMYGQYSALYCTSVDYPALVDIDGDGAVDILNFWVPSTGDYLHYYRNYALDAHGTLDSMDFRIEDWSWGCFAESEESNVIYLDSCRPNQDKGGLIGSSKRFEPKHSGSTICAIPSSTQNSVYDLLIGDVGYTNMVYLKNDGTPEKAHISSFSSSFPDSDPIEMESFPVASTLSANTVLNLDYDTAFTYLCVSPYNTVPYTTQGSQSVWIYKLGQQEQKQELATTASASAATATTAATTATAIERINTSFIQNTMINEGALSAPVFFDYNRDKLIDIVIGYDSLSANSGLTLYENIGSQQKPKFKFISNDFLNLRKKGFKISAISPTFGDYNLDGKEDMILGIASGKLLAFDLKYEEDIAVEAILTDSSFLNLKDLSYTAPCLFDYDSDGRVDLIIGSRQQMWKDSTGKRYSKSSLIYYRNKDGVFEHITDTLGGIDVIDRSFSNYGYSKPSFCRDRDGSLYIVCGAENGKFFCYKASKKDSFAFVGFLPVWLREPNSEESSKEYSLDFCVGHNSAPVFADLDNDGLLDLVSGNARGGLMYAQGIPYRTPQPVSNEEDHAKPPFLEDGAYKDSLAEIIVYPNPVRSNLKIKTAEEVHYTITDITGKVYLSGKLLEGLQNIETSTLHTGIYILKVASNQVKYRPIKLLKL